jgi:hypothetical protein
MADTNLESIVLLSFKGVEPPPHREDIQKRVKDLAAVLGINDSETDGIVKRVEANLITTMDEGVSLVSKDEPHDEDWPKKKNNITWEYWKDYERHLAGESWGPKVIHTMGEVTDKILGLLKDPDELGAWARRGLVIGHVQSGKTSNYIGLISKAADAGYRFIIVIAGIHNNLRKQTQERIDEGFVGRDSQTKQHVGVGLLRKTRAFPIALTNTASDFSRNTAKAITADLEAFDRPVILVIKKNVTTLSNLYSWLKELNANQAGQISNLPLLLIDDEADNASINTNKPDLDPTRTNREIRSLLKLFKKSCYVGYTATPFANIFINPEDEKEMIGDDLFPRNFIYCLDAPTNYFGAQKVFLDEESSSHILRTINDAEDLIPLTHKKYIEIIDIPLSIKTAINSFILVRAIRCVRNQAGKHCSMMINVSRFVDVQRQVKEHVTHYLSDVKAAVRYNYAKPVDEALENRRMADIKKVFDQEFPDIAEKWSEVQRKLLEASDEIKIYLVNSKSDEALDYRKYDAASDSVMALAVGGLSLSRGLTLEGLAVSYMYRNTKMYDTLMQMGRWFGYRAGYEDLCRVYLSEDSRGWYAHIAEATEDLRQQVKQMRRDGFSPEEFGLYVRAHPDALIVTALNKMRHAERRTFGVNFDNKLKETHVIPASLEICQKNLGEIAALYQKLATEYGAPEVDRNYSKGSVYWKAIPVDYILEFMEDFRFHREIQWYKEGFLSYAKKVSDRYASWDVAFISLANSKPALKGLPMAVQRRQVGINNGVIKIPNAENGWYVGNKQKISGTGVEGVGLDDKQIEKARKIAMAENKDLADRYFRHRDVRGRPLLMLHLLELYDGDNLLSKNIPAVGFSFPATGDIRAVDCVVNKVWLQNDMFDSADEEDDYDS